MVGNSHWRQWEGWEKDDPIPLLSRPGTVALDIPRRVGDRLQNPSQSWKKPSLEEYDTNIALLDKWTGGVFGWNGGKLYSTAHYAVRQMGFRKRK